LCKRLFARFRFALRSAKPAGMSEATAKTIQGRTGPCVEALIAGVPVIAAARGGIPETVHDEDNGLLYDPANPDALTACMRRLARETGLLPRLAARSVASVARFSNVQRMLDEYLTLYEQLTARRVSAHDQAPRLELERV